jgi:hypothetical protein
MGFRTFLDLVQQHYEFLTHEYGFVGPTLISKENPPADAGYAEMEYRSATTIVKIYRGRGKDFSVQIGPLDAPDTDFYPLQWIIGFMTGVEKFVHIQVEPFTPIPGTYEEAYQLLQAFLAGKEITPFRNTPIDRQNTERLEVWENHRQSVYASALRQYGDIFLRGDFSQWDNFCKFVEKIIQNDYRSR